MTKVCLTIELNIGVIDHWVWQWCASPLSYTKVCFPVEHDKCVFDHCVWQRCVWPLQNFVILDDQAHLCINQWSSTHLSYSMVKHTFVILNGQKGVFDHWAGQRCVWPSSMTKLCFNIEVDRCVVDHWVWQRCVWSLNMTKVCLTINTHL
jgi:hypothetical protein